jgi:DNA-binding transcriptional ArsR family regulator
MLLVTYYSVIGNESTYRIGLLLSRYALNVKELSTALGLSQPLVSHKLARLRKHGYVRHNRVGKCIIYRFAEPWRSILLHSDIQFHRLNPEYAAEGKRDMDMIRKMIGAELDERQIHPIITGPPPLPLDGVDPLSAHPGGHPAHPREQ